MPSGKPEITCGAKRRQGGEPCGRPAGWGTDHRGHGRCRDHGGASPSGKKAAAAKKVDTEIRSAAAKLLGEAPPVTNVLERLQGIAGEADAWLTASRVRVAELMDDDALTTWSASTGEEIKALVKVYERALDRTTSVCATIAKLNIDARLSAISERDWARLDQAIELAHLSGARGESLEAARSAAAAVLHP